MYNILTGKDNINQEKLLPLSHSTRTRGHSLKLGKKYARLNIRKHSFGRVVSSWSSLPDWVVGAKDMNDFKSKMDKFWKYSHYITRPMHVAIMFTRHEWEPRVGATGLAFFL